MLACHFRSLQVGGFRPSVGCNHDSVRSGLRGSSSTRQSARHLGWSASKSTRLWFSQVYTLDLYTPSSIFVQHFMRSSNSPYPRSDARCNSKQPNRGPKSALVPYRRTVMPTSYGHRGVDLVPLRFNSLGALLQRQSQAFKKHLEQRRPLLTIILAADIRNHIPNVASPQFAEQLRGIHLDTVTLLGADTRAGLI